MLFCGVGADVNDDDDDNDNHDHSARFVNFMYQIYLLKSYDFSITCSILKGNFRFTFLLQ